MKSKTTKKRINTSIKREKPELIVMDEFYSLKDMQTVPVSEHYLNMLAKRLYAWVKAKQGYTLEEFCMDEDIHWMTFYRWKEKNPTLKEAYNYALTALGAIRERGAIERKLDSGIVSYTQAHYSPVWKGLAEWKAKLKQEAESPTEAKVVVIEKFPDEDKK